jgi:hypothetical protein
MRVDHDRVESIFSAAVATGGPAERARYLDGACRDEPRLRERVEELLASHDAAGGFLARPSDREEPPIRGKPATGAEPTEATP